MSAVVTTNYIQDISKAATKGRDEKLQDQKDGLLTDDSFDIVPIRELLNILILSTEFLLTFTFISNLSLLITQEFALL